MANYPEPVMKHNFDYVARSSAYITKVSKIDRTISPRDAMNNEWYFARRPGYGVEAVRRSMCLSPNLRGRQAGARIFHVVHGRVLRHLVLSSERPNSSPAILTPMVSIFAPASSAAKPIHSKENTA